MTSCTFQTPEQRWAGVGPYYAMFPREFADGVITQFTDENDIVLDPFAGRSTSIYSAATHGRKGIGIELNPVGWVYGKAKLHTATQSDVETRLLEIRNLANEFTLVANTMPNFFHHCFCSSVLKFLLAARANLRWKHRPSDWTLMALLLVYLHGKYGQALSNQMRQTKAMSPEYAMNWWATREMLPPDIDPYEFMLKRIAWRYAKGQPTVTNSHVYLGDCSVILSKLSARPFDNQRKGIRLLFTSPPYQGVTNYHYDQWIRLWLLGFSTAPNYSMGKHRQRFNQVDEYRRLLNNTFVKSARLMNNDGIVYVRTDAREITLNTTKEALQKAFPQKTLTVINQPYTQATQTRLFGPQDEVAGGEVDLILA